MSRQVVCLSTSNFYPVPTRKQNVMTRLRDTEILYVDPPVSLLAPLKDPAAWKRLLAFRKAGTKAGGHITVVASPPVLPFFNRFRWINRINQRILAGYLRKRIRAMGFDRPWLWCYSPASCDAVPFVPNRGVIYDCVDRHSAYPGQIDPAVVDRMEEDLARQAVQVFCTAQGLFDRLRAVQPATALIPNGADYALFSQAAEPADWNETVIREDAAATRRPVFGFVGMLQDCIDYDLLEYLARERPGWDIVLVGRELPGVDLSRLARYPNIRKLGLKPQAELPALIRNMDVCLNLFRDGDLAKDVSPLKFYEYLATGKPVVSTRMPLQVLEYADVVYIADGPEDFVVQCELALAENDPQKRAKRMEYGKACSWEERVRQMETCLPDEWRSQ